MGLDCYLIRTEPEIANIIIRADDTIKKDWGCNDRDISIYANEKLTRKAYLVSTLLDFFPKEEYCMYWRKAYWVNDFFLSHPLDIKIEETTVIVPGEVMQEFYNKLQRYVVCGSSSIPELTESAFYDLSRAIQDIRDIENKFHSVDLKLKDMVFAYYGSW